MQGRSKRFAPAAILVVAVLIFVYLKNTRPQQEMAAASERVWYVETVTVNPEPLSPSLTLYGQVETPDLVKAAAPKEGQVLDIRVREGSAITPGELLLKLDARDFEAVVVQREARVAELEAMIESEKLRYRSDQQALEHEKSLLKLSKAAVGRAEKMKAKNLGSAAALDQAYQELERQNLSLNIRTLNLKDHRSRLNQLEARLKDARADLALARLDLERSEIHSPFEGFVSEISVASGDRVSENQQLLSMYPADTLEVRTLIPAPHQAELQQALYDGASLEATAYHANYRFTLKLDRFAGAASTRGIDALFTIEKDARLLRLGNTLPLQLVRPTRDSAVAVPYSALYGRDKVYKLEAGRMRSIRVDNLGDFVDGNGATLLLVSSPALGAGDRIITTHLPNAVNGLRVESRNPDDPASLAGIRLQENPPESQGQP